MINIAGNILKIQNKIRQYELRYQRQPFSVSLLAASKSQPVEKMQQAVLAQQMSFGENYLQEALQKMKLLASPAIDWHFIGSLQSNKIKKVATYFNWVHTVDSIKIASGLNKHRPLSLPPLNICLQVNVSTVEFDNLLQLAEYCAAQPNLKLRGLMTIAAQTNSFQEQREEFHRLNLLFSLLNKHNFKLDTLSMGMSDDMEAAIAEGATIIRIGTAIFGDRIPK